MNNFMSTLLLTSALTVSVGVAAQEAQPLTFDNAPNGYELDLSQNSGAGVVTFGQRGDSKAGSMPNVTNSSITNTQQGYDLALPDYNGTTTWSVGSDSAFTATSPNGTHLSGSFSGAAAANLTYANYGAWETTGSSAAGLSLGVFASGVPGPNGNDRPISGGASYNGKATGYATYVDAAQLKLNGDVTLNADFGNNTISGRVTNMTAASIDATNRSLGVAIATNDIALSNGLITGTSFAGDARIAWTASQQMSLGGAVGSFGGGFYGPNAAEAAGTISMTNAGTGNIVAAFGAAK